MIFTAAGDVLNHFTPIATGKFRAAFTGGAHISNGKALIVSHRDNGRLAPARVSFEADLLGVNRRIGFKIIESAARTPRPCAQNAPVFRLAILALVHQADDSSTKAGAVI